MDFYEWYKKYGEVYYEYHTGFETARHAWEAALKYATESGQPQPTNRKRAKVRANSGNIK